MAFPTYDLILEQGVTYKFNLAVQDLTGTPIDVTGWSFTGTIKDATNTSLNPVALLTITSVLPISGTLFVALPASEAEKLVKKRYYYDIIGMDPNPSPIEYTRILQGKVTVDLGVTSLTDL